jgi:hypothetical protein
MGDTQKKTASRIFELVKYFYIRNKLVVFFFLSHVSFAIFLGRMFAFAPDEQGYLFVFNNVYTLPVDSYDKSGNAWSTAPTIFLWFAYLPAKILNLVGVSDYLSIRLLSIAITTLSLFLLLKMKQNFKQRVIISQELIFFSFFIPSVFLWTSIGLREAFIIFEISLFLVGLNYLFLKKTKVGITFLIVGSYGLLSTKPYLWVLLMASLIIIFIVYLILRNHINILIKLVIASFIAPLILFAATSSLSTLSFIFSSSITETGLRSGDSITQFGDFTFNGDYTLIALHSYLLENPDSAFSEVFGVLNLDEKVKSLWNEKLQSGLISDGKLIDSDAPSLNSHTLKPGLIDEPWTMLWPAFLFLAGPFPFVGEPTVAAEIASFESPFWWVLYTLVFHQFYRFRRSKLFRDPVILFALIFLAGEIAFSSLVEVNLGTSFRHRSILLVPLVFLYLRIAHRAHELRDPESKPIL